MTPTAGFSQARQASPTTRNRTALSGRQDHASAQMHGLTNARTRIVGYREGLLADVIVTLVRFNRTANARLSAWAGRLAGVVTPLGWALLIIVPVSLAAGYRLGWTELAAVGYAGAVMIVIAAVYLIGRSPFILELTLPHHRVVIGDEASGVVSIENPTRRRILGVKVEIPVGRGLAELVLPSVTRGSSFQQDFSVPTSRRGVFQVGPVRTVRADPVGLVRRELIWTEAAELVVHPRTIAIPSTSTGLIRDLEGNATRDLTNSDVAFHALREYMPGDERRYIHWKSTAKTGTYMVRQFEETRRSHLVVALSLATTDYADEEEFELAVSVAGSLGVRAIRDVRNVSVVASMETPEFAKRKTLAVRRLSTLTRARLLDDLAVVEQSESALGISDVARVTAEQVTGISVAFLVCGSLPTPGQLRSASTKFSTGVEVVAVVCDPETVPGLRQVSGLSVLTIGYLEDLQKSLAKSAAA
ncbi:MAG: DUF58 domain-containing protein [Homoserinimonas sp.]